MEGRNFPNVNWDERADDYPLTMDRPSTLYAIDLIKKEAEGFDTIVDVGCGPGNESIPFSQFFGRVYSVDSSPRMLARLRKECSERKIENIETIESDCIGVQLPEKCQVAFSCLCPGMFSPEGMGTLERLSDDFCVFIGHLYEEDCIERKVFEDAGLRFESKFDTLRVLDEFRGERDITQKRFADFPQRKPEELLRRCLRIAEDATDEERERLEERVSEVNLSSLPDENNVIVLSWHKTA